MCIRDSNQSRLSGRNAAFETAAIGGNHFLVFLGAYNALELSLIHILLSRFFCALLEVFSAFLLCSSSAFGTGLNTLFRRHGRSFGNLTLLLGYAFFTFLLFFRISFGIRLFFFRCQNTVSGMAFARFTRRDICLLYTSRCV